MALAISIPIDGHGIEGIERTVRGTLALDTSYPTGGYALTPRNLGLGAINDIEVRSKNGYVFEYNYTAQLLLVYRSLPAGTVAAPTIDGAAGTIRVTGGQVAGAAVQIQPDAAGAAVGKTAVTDRDATTVIGGITASAPAFTGTAGALVEVANGVNLSAVTGVRFFARGC